MNTFFRPGQLVYWRNQAAIILELKGLSDAIIRTIENPKTEVARTSDLSKQPTSSKPAASYHLLAEDKDWNKAVKRYEIIRPLLEQSHRERSDVEAVAEKAGKSTATIYRWIRRFEETGLVSSLLRSNRADKGSSKLPYETEELIARCIDQYYLKQERPSVLAYIAKSNTRATRTIYLHPRRARFTVESTESKRGSDFVDATAQSGPQKN